MNFFPRGPGFNLFVAFLCVFWSKLPSREVGRREFDDLTPDGLDHGFKLKLRDPRLPAALEPHVWGFQRGGTA